MRAIKWTLFNGAICACAWVGYVEGNEYCVNAFSFFSVVSFVFGVLSLLASEKTKDKVRERGRSVPAAVSGLSDLFLVVICAAFGHWFYAAAWLVSMTGDVAIYGEKSK